MIDLQQPLAEEEVSAFAGAIASRVVGLGLTTPALLFLEMHRPFARLGGQALVVLAPVLAPVFGMEGVERLSRLIYHPNGIDSLIAAVEAATEKTPERAA